MVSSAFALKYFINSLDLLWKGTRGSEHFIHLADDKFNGHFNNEDIHNGIDTTRKEFLRQASCLNLCK